MSSFNELKNIIKTGKDTYDLNYANKGIHDPSYRSLLKTSISRNISIAEWNEQDKNVGDSLAENLASCTFINVLSSQVIALIEKLNSFRIADYGLDTNISTEDLVDIMSRAHGTELESNKVALGPENTETQYPNAKSVYDSINSTRENLEERISNVESRGRFLALWNAQEGLPTSEPFETPYEYHAGDYYIVSVVGETNYRPSGNSYTGRETPSTVVEQSLLNTDDVYYYDGTSWNLQVNTRKEVSFATIAGDPDENTKLKERFDNIQDKLDNNVYPSFSIVKTLPNVNVDGKIFDLWTAPYTEETKPYFTLKYDGSDLTETNAINWMKFATGNAYLPTFDQNTPKQVYIVFVAQQDYGTTIHEGDLVFTKAQWEKDQGEEYGQLKLYLVKAVGGSSQGNVFDEIHANKVYLNDALHSYIEVGNNGSFALKHGTTTRFIVNYDGNVYISNAIFPLSGSGRVPIGTEDYEFKEVWTPKLITKDSNGTIREKNVKDLLTSNDITPGNRTNAVNTNTVIGHSSNQKSASGVNNTIYGYKAIMEGNNGVVIGASANSYSSCTTTVGANASASSMYSTAIGCQATTISSCEYSTIVGQGAQCNNSQYATIVGASSSAVRGNYGVAIGNSASVSATNSIAIGYQAKVYVPRWTSFDGTSDDSVKTLSFKTTDNIFFRNENVSSSKTSQAAYTNGQTLTQVLAQKADVSYVDEQIAALSGVTHKYQHTLKIDDTVNELYFSIIDGYATHTESSLLASLFNNYGNANIVAIHVDDNATQSSVLLKPDVSTQSLRVSFGNGNTSVFNIDAIDNDNVVQIY